MENEVVVLVSARTPDGVFYDLTLCDKSDQVIGAMTASGEELGETLQLLANLKHVDCVRVHRQGKKT